MRRQLAISGQDDIRVELLVECRATRSPEESAGIFLGFVKNPRGRQLSGTRTESGDYKLSGIFLVGEYRDGAFPSVRKSEVSFKYMRYKQEPSKKQSPEPPQNERGEYVLENKHHHLWAARAIGSGGFWRFVAVREQDKVYLRLIPEEIAMLNEL